MNKNNSLTQPRTSGWPLIGINSSEILACGRVQCFCVQLKRNWGRGEGGRHAVFIFPLPTLSSPVQLCPTARQSFKKRKYPDFVRCPSVAIELLLSRVTSQVGLSKRSTGWLTMTTGQNREDLHFELEVNTITWSCTSCPSTAGSHLSVVGSQQAKTNPPLPLLHCLY